jgi:hypothetical protein
MSRFVFLAAQVSNGHSYTALNRVIAERLTCFLEIYLLLPIELIT